MNNFFKERIVLHSSVTDIYYKTVKGVLYKYPDYPGAARGWDESMYTGAFSHMNKVSKADVKRLENKC